MSNNTIDSDRLALFAAFLSLISSTIAFIIALRIVVSGEDSDEIVIP